MARFQDSLTLVPVPRSLVDDVARALLDALEGLPLPNGRLDVGTDSLGDVRLVEGEHLTAGARYQVVLQEMDDEDLHAELKVVSWNRSGESQVEIRTDYDGHVVNARVALRMGGQRLHTFRVEGDYQGPGPLRMLQRAKWEAEARFEDWWATLGPGTTPPISLRVSHPLALASFLVGRGKDEDQRWSANSTLRLRGRWIMRPLAAIGLLIMRSRIRRMLRMGFDRTETAWNAAVPGMAERGLQERVTVRHQVEVKSVSREWAEEYVAALHRHIGELRFENGRLAGTSTDIRLLEGDHIRPGTRYRVVPDGSDENESGKRADSLDISVTAWDPDGPSRIEFNSPENAQTGWAELDSARRPTLMRVAFDGELEEIKRLGVTAEGDLERWWAGVTGTGDDSPAFVARIEQPLGKGTFSIAGSPAEDDRWKVDVSFTAEGRGWARALIAVVGLLSGAAVQDQFEATTDEAATDWNETVSKATEADFDLAAKTTLHQLLNNSPTAAKPD